ncbi:MAG: M67 family peptidase [Nitrospiraceae bacterium]|nr:MAG: M67 family peptidase [Nitrospiraceae bacterium]
MEQIIAHCRSEYPIEACGLLAGTDNRAEKMFAMTNVEPSNVSYMMDPGEQFKAMKEMRANGNRMVAIFHSHPHSLAYPSPKDVSLAFYSDSLYLIIGLSMGEEPEIRAFEIVDGTVREVRIECSVDASSGDGLK